MEILHFTPEKELIEQLRYTTTLTDKSMYLYKDAKITIEDMPIEDFLPTQMYVMKDHLETQRNIRRELLNKNYDTFKLMGGITLRKSGIETTMIPPIVEEDDEFGPCLLDGTHRAYLARQLGMKTLGVVYVSGVLNEIPMIALPNRWGDIAEYSVIPDSSQKKRRRNLAGSKYDYYRDFSAITGVGKDPRSEMVLQGV